MPPDGRVRWTLKLPCREPVALEVVAPPGPEHPPAGGEVAAVPRELVEFHFHQAETIVLVCDHLNMYHSSVLCEAFPTAAAHRCAPGAALHAQERHVDSPTGDAQPCMTCNHQSW